MKKSAKNVVAIILARGGSKGLPRKNILPLNGEPLISYSINAANQSKYVDRTIVSTDDHEIAVIARKKGAETPFLRPKELSTDTATTEVALKHAVDWLINTDNYSVDIVVYLQITDVFRKKNMIDDCVKILLDNPEVDSAFMGLVMHKNFWQKNNRNYKNLTSDIPYGIPRQHREPIFREDTGLALATKASVILEGKRIGKNVRIVPYEQDVDFIDIHSKFDLWLSEMLINEGNVEPNE